MVYLFFFKCLIFKRNYFEEFNTEKMIDFLFDQDVLTLFLGLNISVPINPNMFSLKRTQIVEYMKQCERMYVFFGRQFRMKNKIVHNNNKKRLSQGVVHFRLDL